MQVQKTVDVRNFSEMFTRKGDHRDHLRKAKQFVKK